MTAIDFNKGTIPWQAAVGDMPSVRNNPLLKGLTLPPLGATGRAGSLVTAAGLIFMGPGDNKVYGLDVDNGIVLWPADLPHPANASPMTYRSRSRRQFVVIGTGGGKAAALEAFASPEKQISRDRGTGVL
jgi:glucose dehydrogenase